MTFEETFRKLGRMFDWVIESFWDLIAQLPDAKIREVLAMQNLTPEEIEEVLKIVRRRRT